MKNIDEHIDLIERYLSDDMTQEELEEFNGLLRKDPEFNKLFYEMDHLLEGIRRSAKQTTVEEKLARLEKSLPSKEQSLDSEGSASVIPIWSFVKNYKMAIAAVFTLFFAATILFLNIPNNNSPSSIFSDYYVPFENQSSMTLRGGDEKAENAEVELLRQALSEYDKANYAGSIEIFNKISDNSENKISVWMYKGNAYLHEGEVENAKIMFQKIINEKAGFEIHAKWYLSLCYIKNGEYENAKPLLEEIKGFGKYKSEEAGKILSKI